MIIYRQCSLLYTLPTAVCWRPLGSWGPRLKPIQPIGKYGPEINVTQFFMVMEFLGNVFTNLFLKNFSRMKRWWREELQLPVGPVATGGLWGLTAQTKLQAPQTETRNTINQLRFCQFLECQAPRINPKPPRRNANLPYWKLSGDGFCYQ